MFKKTITYEDYNGVERTEDFYFNLSKAEVTEMEMSVDGGYAEMLRKIVSKQDAPTIMKTFKEFIIRSYGEKSADGKRFIKNQMLTEAFLQTEAYSNLFVELCTDAGAASNFINGILPKVPEDHNAPVKPVTD